MAGLYEHLLGEMRKAAERVNEVLLSAYRVEPKVLDDSAMHILTTGGKRVRPFITLKVCEALGGDVEAALPVAAAVELIHNFSLIHDDIMDRDRLRHGVPTVHVMYGEPMAILAGDVLFAKAFAIASERIGAAYPPALSLEMVNVLAKASIALCEGQALDMLLGSAREVPSMEEYMRVIEKKTAALMAAAARLGGLAARADPGLLGAVSDYGRSLGLAFQITDDLLSLVGRQDLTGKPVGSDLREGKKTLPIILAFQRAGAQAHLIWEVWGVKTADEQRMQEALTYIRSLGVEEEVRGISERHAGEARRALSALPDSPAKALLDELAEFVARREY
jgi:geranylgeranyl diphosphate synthase type I